jgi:BirA family biotin operon repressor/biotin-[acetyl-CoA-carboxylase] ligase
MTKHWVHKYNLLIYDHLDSTNSEALRLAHNGVKGNHVIFAKLQTDGRGRHGKHWDSPEGNFYLSLLLDPIFTVQSGAELSFVTSLAVKDAIMYVLGINYLNISFKWPNDILLNGKKLGGILLESSSTPQKNIPDWFIVGVGINLMHYPNEADYPATSLKDEGFGEVPVNLVLNAFMESFSTRYMWRNRGFNTLRLEWVNNAFNLNKPVTVIFKGEKLQGIFEDIDEAGSLLMRLPDGQIKKIVAGEVFFESNL